MTDLEVMLINDITDCPQTFLSSDCVAYVRAGEPVKAGERSMGCPATLVPNKSVIVPCVVDRAGNTFVWHDVLFPERTEFSLAHYVGADNIVYGFVFHDRDRPGLGHAPRRRVSAERGIPLDGKTGLVPDLVSGFQDWKYPGTLAQT